jgi:hypothetical protein
VAVRYEKIFEGHDEGASPKDTSAERRNGTGQRLQRQGNCWESELEAWKKYYRGKGKQIRRTQDDFDRMDLGCALLIELTNLLHADMYQSNSETLNPAQKTPPRRAEDCSLLLSVTDPAMPYQPGSDVRYWLPEDRQLKQPATDAVIRDFLAARRQRDPASSEIHPKSAQLEAMLSTLSLDALEQRCKQLKSPPVRKLNRLQMAECILFDESANFAAKGQV